MNSNIDIQATSVVPAELSNIPSVQQSILLQRNQHPSLSSKYVLINSYDVVKQFQNLGFEWKFRMAKNKRHGNNQYAAHLIELSHPDIVFGRNDLDREVKPVIYLKNSYDGTLKYGLDLGIFRSYCANGLFVGLLLDRYVQKHINVQMSNVSEAIVNMKDTINNRLIPLIDKLMTEEMSTEEQLNYARQALATRFRQNEGFVGGEYEKLLTVHRTEDQGNSKWKVLNRVQENLGLNGRDVPVELNYKISSKDENGNAIIKMRKIRTVKGLDEVTYLNKSLFDLVNKTNEITPNLVQMAA